MTETTSPHAPKAYASIIEATELPRIIHVTGNLYAAAFSLMKLLPARFIVDRAERAGLLTPGTPVIETSSGTFALGLAMVCAQRGYPLTIVGDPAIDRDLRNRLEMLGTKVVIVHDEGQAGGIQGARLARVAELRREHPDSFVPGQYDNPTTRGRTRPWATLSPSPSVPSTVWSARWARAARRAGSPPPCAAATTIRA